MFHQSKGKELMRDKERSSHKGRPNKPINLASGCFLCGGNHLARNCPEKQVLNASVTEKASALNRKKKTLVSSSSKSNSDDSDDSGKGTSSRKPNMGALRLLNIMKVQVGEPRPKKQTKDFSELMYASSY